MSQRKALIASLIITLVLALSAIGIRAALVDSPTSASDSAGTLTLVEPGGGEYDDDDRYEDSDENSGYEDSDEDNASQDSDDDDDNAREDHEDEEDDDDAE